MKKNLFAILLSATSLAAFIHGSSHAQGIIHTIAGTPSMAGFAGDGGLAVGARFSNPSGVATDAAGNIYITDRYNHRVRKIDIATGRISTVAGSGLGIYSGMGGAALDAGMEYPNSIFIDGSGDYYLTDFFADCSYKISGTGTINNDCGDGTQGSGGDGGLAEMANMELPKAVWKDHSGNTYIADYGNNRVRLVDAAHIAHTFTGGPGLWGFSPNGTARTSCLWGSVDGVCADNVGNVYVSDATNHVVRMIDGKGNVYTIAGNGTAGYSGDGGPALLAKLSSPGCLFVNSAGNLFICDNGNHTVRVINVRTGGGIIKTVAGTGSAGFSGDGGFANAAQLSAPNGVWEDASGTIYIADEGNQVVRSITGSGYRTVNGLASTAAEDNILIYPNPSNGTFTFTTDNVQGNTSLEIYNMTGQLVHSETLTLSVTTIRLVQPAGIYNVVARSAAGTSTRRIVIE